MNAMKFAVPLIAALAYCPSQGWAVPVLDSQLSSFAVLGASTVTNTGGTTLVGNLGVAPGSAITGFFGTVENDGPGTFAGAAHQADAFALTAQGKLANAKISLGLLGPSTLEPADLGGLTLDPGVYTVLAGTSNLTGTLTLDGGGDANAFWVFQMSSTLITSVDSVVNVINTGAGAGVYWNVGTAATLDTRTTFEGNILAVTSITMNDGVKLSCGRALAQTGAVTMIRDTVNAVDCAGTGEEGSTGLSGGLAVPFPGGVPQPLPFAPAIPEPGTCALMLAGLSAVGFAARRNRRPGGA